MKIVPCITVWVWRWAGHVPSFFAPLVVHCSQETITCPPHSIYKLPSEQLFYLRFLRTASVRNHSTCGTNKNTNKQLFLWFKEMFKEQINSTSSKYNLHKILVISHHTRTQRIFLRGWLKFLSIYLSLAWPNKSPVN